MWLAILKLSKNVTGTTSTDISGKLRKRWQIKCVSARRWNEWYPGPGTNLNTILLNDSCTTCCLAITFCEFPVNTPYEINSGKFPAIGESKYSPNWTSFKRYPGRSQPTGTLTVSPFANIPDIIPDERHKPIMKMVIMILPGRLFPRSDRYHRLFPYKNWLDRCGSRLVPGIPDP